MVKLVNLDEKIFTTNNINFLYMYKKFLVNLKQIT